ncbi:hypothetical protein ACFY2R_20860 [Micromonospora olivasterospora]|uniref:hypothetical protein n=1 Tax=Micromonospora olivasterospora TaxID=1880 RepID=UPI0011A52E1A|nr:hypothetical protein [Micromonospora olivasterospora]
MSFEARGQHRDEEVVDQRCQGVANSLTCRSAPTGPAIYGSSRGTFRGSSRGTTRGALRRALPPPGRTPRARSKLQKKRFLWPGHGPDVDVVDAPALPEQVGAKVCLLGVAMT